MAKRPTKITATSGHRPRVKKMFDGRDTATRPIPVIVDSVDRRKIAAAAADQKSQKNATRMPSGPRVGGVEEIFGTRIRTTGGSPFNPATGLGKTI